MKKINPTDNKIAVIGMSCRFPGGANNPELFWNVLEYKKDVIGEIPAARWDVEAFYDADREAAGKMYTRSMGSLDTIDMFDNQFFKVAPIEAESMDPQMRLLLELSYEAIENGGQDLVKLKGSRTGVFLGIANVDYMLRNVHSHNPGLINYYSLTGNSISAASGRISFVYGFEGPSLTLDTACSSALVSVHYGCKSLLTGESDLILAGAANLILSPELHIVFSKLKALSSDGRCKAFDASANGFVRSEGAGMVLLKRYNDAVRDKDNILAVIAGSAVTNDGASEGFVAPRMESQEKAIRDAMEQAGVSVEDVDFIEAHGAGTAKGDPIELGAIGNVFKDRSTASGRILVGSVKTNIGHTEAVAGMAGLIKTVLSLQHEKIPANLHFNTPNPSIPWEEIPVTIPVETLMWKRNGKPRVAGVNAFGISGTNAHLIVCEKPEEEGSITKDKDSSREAHTMLLPLSASSAPALEAMTEQYKDLLEGLSGEQLEDLCYTASLRRTHFPYRLAVAGATREEMEEGLAAAKASGLHLIPIENRGDDRNIVFIFPGQGSQWIGMGRDLYKKEPVFRQSMIACEQAIQKYTDWKLLEEIHKDESTSRFGEVNVIQPVIFAMQVSLAALWQSWGIEPSIVVGHSMGEAAAAYVSGALSLEDAAKIICVRSRLARSLSGTGAMAVVELSMEKAQDYVSQYEDKVSVAVSNAPNSTVLSGDPACIQKILQELESKGIFARPVKVDFASHSPQVDQLKPALASELADVRPHKGKVSLYSTVKNRFSDGGELDAAYWTDNLRDPVLFSQAVQHLLAHRENLVFLEVSPHPVLLPLIEQNIEFMKKTASVCHSLKRDKEEQREMMQSLASLYTLGARLKWEAFYPEDSYTRMPLPSYPWQKEKFWLEAVSSSVGASSLSRKKNHSSHPLLGSALHIARQPYHCYEININSRAIPYLNDHVVNGVAIYPAAAYIEQVLAVASEIYGKGNHLVENIQFKHALQVSGDDKIVQIIFTSEREGLVSFRFYSNDGENFNSDDWVSHCEGFLRIHSEGGMGQDEADRERFIAGCETHISKEKHYSRMDDLGIQYGKRFRGVEEIWSRGDKAMARIVAEKTISESLRSYLVHPALLDACFQVSLATVSATQEQKTYLPYSISRITALPDMISQGEIWARVEPSVEREETAGTFVRDLFIYGNDGTLLMKIEGFTFKELEPQEYAAEQIPLEECFYKMKWEAYEVSYEKQIAAGKEKAMGNGWVVFTGEEALEKALVKGAEKIVGTVIKVKKDLQAGNLVKESQHAYTLNPADPAQFRMLFDEIAASGCTPERLVYLWGMHEHPGKGDKPGDNNCLHLISLLQSLGQTKQTLHPRLVLVTRGSQQVLQEEAPDNIFQSAVWGLGRVIFHEHQEYGCHRIDVSKDPDPAELEKLLNTILFEDKETEIALRGKSSYVGRLVRHAPGSSVIPVEKKMVSSRGRSFKVVTDEPGLLDNLVIREAPAPAPSAGELEVEVRAVGLNFMNVMSALGIYPGYPRGFRSLGIEFSGTVTRTGPGVKGFVPGDEVMGCAEECMGKLALTKASLVVKKPAKCSFEDAATVPIAFLTAWFSLCTQGVLKKGERVLIHSATGGVGLAAIQIAENAGAEIYATAGTEEKRALLRSLGVKYVYDSRSLDFAEAIRRQTNGEGIDVVLNSLTGEAMYQSLLLLRPFGRFLEIGKKDIYNDYKISLGVFKNSISYHFIDLDKMIREQPSMAGILLKKVARELEAGNLLPLPSTVYPVTSVADGFRFMSGGKHTGKIVFGFPQNDIDIEPAVKGVQFEEGDTFLITGGLGGLGLALTEWMAERGARNFVLAGRRGPSEDAKKVLQRLKRGGVNVHLEKADISETGDVKDMLERVRATMPPLKGVIHAAGVLEDCSLMNMNEEKFLKVIAPKIYGAWNLHLLTQKDKLKHFVVFSSVASLLGSVGQGNYVAGNAFLDSLAAYRASQNMPVKCLNWGPVSDVGLAAADDIRGKRLAEEGIAGMNVAEYLQCFEKAILESNAAQLGIMRLNVRRWIEHNPSYSKDSLLQELIKQENAGEHSQGTSAFRDELFACASLEESIELLKEHLREHLSAILKSSASRIDYDAPLASLGVDSLMAIQYRNRLEKSLGLNVSVTVFWNYPKVRLLADHLAGELGLKAHFSGNAGAAENVTDKVEEEVNQLSAEEVGNELDRELNSIL